MPDLCQSTKYKRYQTANQDFCDLGGQKTKKTTVLISICAKGAEKAVYVKIEFLSGKSIFSQKVVLLHKNADLL